VNPRVNFISGTRLTLAMRLFVAIEPDEKVRAHLESLQKKIISPGVKLTITRGHHLTLKFLGDVSDGTADRMKAELETIRFEKFQLETSDIGFFPDQKDPRVIWVGVKPKDKILKLHAGIDIAAGKLGFLRDDRFHPHITLARVKYLDDKSYPEKIRQLKTEKLSFAADSFCLYKSELLPTGPDYTKIYEKRSE
jgi:RNA 2',3'-cyclic 3'-phosphodiesterase